MFSQVITVEKYDGASIDRSSRIVKSERLIELTDHKLLNYILGCDVTDECIEVKIELLDEVIETFNHEQQTTLLFIEKLEGIFYIHRKQIGITELSIDNANKLMMTDSAVTRITGMEHCEIMQSDVDGKEGSYAVVFDLGKVNRYRMTAETGDRAGGVNRLINDNGLGPYLFCMPFSYINSSGLSEMVTLRFLPDVEQFIESTRTTLINDRNTFTVKYLEVARLYDKTGTLLSEHVIED